MVVVSAAGMAGRWDASALPLAARAAPHLQCLRAAPLWTLKEREDTLGGGSMPAEIICSLNLVFQNAILILRSSGVEVNSQRA